MWTSCATRPTNTTGLINAGKVRGLCGDQPQAHGRPGAEHAADAGTRAGLKGFEVSIWQGLYAPKGTPEAVVERLNAALKIAVRGARFRPPRGRLGSVMISDERVNGPQHRNFVAAEIRKWAPILKAAGPIAE